MRSLTSARIAESPDPDPLCPDPVGELAMQLESVTDPALFIQYALWLVGKDEEKGLTVRSFAPRGV